MAQRLSYWQRFRGSIQGVNCSWQLALGVAIGMMIGLLPKESLLFVAMVILVIVSPANLLTAALSAILFSLVGCWEPVMSAMHQLGLVVLNQQGIQTFFGRLLATPLMPWLRLDNSIVMGGLVLGAILSLPVYFVSLVFFDRLGLHLYERVRSSSWCRWLIGPPNSKTTEGTT